MLMPILRAQRHHVVATLDGLSDAQLRTVLPPVTWAPIAAVHHLALDVERWWFQGIVANDARALAYFEANPGGAWSVPARTRRVLPVRERMRSERRDHSPQLILTRDHPRAGPSSSDPNRPSAKSCFTSWWRPPLTPVSSTSSAEMLDGHQYRVLDQPAGSRSSRMTKSREGRRGRSAPILVSGTSTPATGYSCRFCVTMGDVTAKSGPRRSRYGGGNAAAMRVRHHSAKRSWNVGRGK